MDRKQKLTGIVAVLILINLIVLHEWRLRKQPVVERQPEPPIPTVVYKAVAPPVAKVVPEDHESEFRPVVESVCINNGVESYENPPYPTEEENRAHGNRWMGTLAPEDNLADRVRVIRNEGNATYIETDNRGRRSFGWVMKGTVKPLCASPDGVAEQHEWHPYQESVCESSVRMTQLRGGGAWLTLKPTETGRLRILWTDGDDLYIATDHRFFTHGWVKKDQVADSCPVDEANDMP